MSIGSDDTSALGADMTLCAAVGKPAALARGWRRLALFTAVVCALWVTWVLVSATDTRGNDDAGILWTYARNVVEGHGLVYKPGEYVEGFSSLSYVLLLSAGMWCVQTLGPLLGFTVSLKAMYWIALGINVAAWISVIVVVFRFVSEELNARAASVVSILLGLNPMIGYWVASGMDTPVAMLSQVLIWVWVLRLDRRAGTAEERRALYALTAAMMFSMVTRAEGFLWPILAMAWLLVRGHRKQALAAGGLFVAFAACVVGWRLWYYGYPLPNTYYAKVAGTLSQRIANAWYGQSARVVFQSGLLVAVLAIFAGIVAVAGSFVRLAVQGKDARHGDRALQDSWRFDSALAFEVTAGCAWLAYFLYVGGDVYYERPMLVLVPLGLVIGARVLQPSINTLGSASLAIAAALTIMMHPLWSYYGPEMARYRGDGLEKIGRYLGETYPGATVALNLAGKIAYYSGLPCIDMIGLCDATVAHSQQDNAFVVGHTKRGFKYALGRKPEIVAVCPQVYTGDAWDLVIDDGYTIADMRSIGYQPVALCNAVDWSIVRKVSGKLLQDMDSAEIKELVARNKFDLILFYNPKPTGEIPKVASGL
ncbi:MAG: hypothetical protein IT367_04990 [Candidatus Hydrogenedentes bacterium]|nr:hypothetical protein [Candidatus Hydrogenedentota bacterium]